MLDRTPVIGKLPKVLLRNERPDRTPVINGAAVVPISDLFARDSFSDQDLEAAVTMAGAAPEHDPAWANVHEQMLEVSCAYFAAEMIQGPKEAPYDGKFIIGSHHLDWDKQVNEHKRICIMAARDHGKSFFFTMAFPIWKAGYNAPKSEGIIFSATQPQAEKFLGKIKDELLSNPKLAHLVPYTGDRYWSARKITLRNGSTIYAAGFGVKVRGAHPDWVVCDDVLNDDDIYSEITRRRNIDYFLSAITGMVHRSKQLIVVGTPMHHDDLYNALNETGEYHCTKFPAINDNGTPLWHDRYSLEDLMAKKRELKSAARFAREFLCEPLSDEASLFPHKLFEGSDINLPYRLGLPAAYWEERGFLRYTGVDIALSAETGADYFIIFTIAVSPTGERWVANLRRGHGWSFTRQIDAIKEEHALMLPELIYIEANQAQRVWTDEIVRTTDLPVVRFFTSGVGGAQPKQKWRRGATSISVNKHHIDRGVPGMRLSLENRKWRFPKGDAESIELVNLWIGEMSCMGWIDGKVQSVGKHDDFVMACWMCDTAATDAGGASLDMDARELVSPAEKPVISDTTNVEVDLLEAERLAMTAIEERKPVQISRNAYLARVRSALRTAAERLVDEGSHQAGARILGELSRLDSIHKFKAHDPEFQDVVKRNGEAYRPDEHSPRADEL